MFENKRNSIIKVMIILLLLVSVNVFINIPFVSAGRWEYQSTVEDVYNITISSDDAVSVIDSYFSLNGESITLKSNIYSSIIGLRFDNISIPSNSTYEYRPVNAYISLYSDHYPYDPYSEKVTIYFERDNDNIQTFSNYSELVSRTPSYNYRNWDLDDVHGLNSTSGQWNDSPNIAILVNGATGFDNDTICFLIYSDNGVWFRYFRTIDHYSGYAPRLHIISQIYEYEESPPSGYESSSFVEQYRGYDIFENTDNDNWLQYDNYPEVDTADFIRNKNNTYFDFVGFIVLNQDSYLRREISYEVTDIINIKFGLDVDSLTSAGATTSMLIGHWGLSMDGKPYSKSDGAFMITTEKDVGQNTRLKFAMRTLGENPEDQVIIPYTAEANLSDVYPKYLDVTYIFSTKYFGVDLYNDSAMTILYNHVNVTWVDVIEAGDVSYEYALFDTDDSAGAGHTITGKQFTIYVADGYIVADTDGSFLVFLPIDVYEDIEDVREWIDNYLSASPEYDKTPWMGDFTILLVGLVGIAFIPLGFLIFVSSVRDGDIIGGLQTLVIMFFIGIGCIITWLWA